MPWQPNGFSRTCITVESPVTHVEARRFRRMPVALLPFARPNRIPTCTDLCRCLSACVQMALLQRHAAGPQRRVGLPAPPSRPTLAQPHLGLQRPRAILQHHCRSSSSSLSVPSLASSPGRRWVMAPVAAAGEAPHAGGGLAPAATSSTSTAVPKQAAARKTIMSLPPGTPGCI